jgi:hypothetical protein
MEVSGQLHVPATLPPGEIAQSTHKIGGWVGLKCGLDAKEKRKDSCLCQTTHSVNSPPPPPQEGAFQCDDNGG